MNKVAVLLSVLLILGSCGKKSQKSDLEEFVDSNAGLTEDFLIACAAGNLTEFMGNTSNPIAVFYYNVDGAATAELYIKSGDGAKEDYSQYSKVNEPSESLFNGRMGKFSLPASYDGEWVIVTYTAGNTYHISDPIIIRAASNPTADISSHIIQTGDSLLPHFDWTSETTAGNVIYFSLISNSQDDFVSGTYTTDKTWQFYDLSNVVLNVTPTSNPILSASENYSYTHMGVDEDNWVRSMGSLTF